jgi:hypothetical protein
MWVLSLIFLSCLVWGLVQVPFPFPACEDPLKDRERRTAGLLNRNQYSFPLPFFLLPSFLSPSLCSFPLSFYFIFGSYSCFFLAYLSFLIFFGLFFILPFFITLVTFYNLLSFWFVTASSFLSYPFCST